jgi:uncharacterized BrkB/YihY/UPF0761 family membrane protein
VLAVAGAILVAVANVGMFFLSFRVLMPKAVPTRKLVPGVATGGLAWTVLQALGTYVVGHLRETKAVYGAFTTVLVLLAASRVSGWPQRAARRFLTGGISSWAPRTRQPTR